MFKNYLKVAYRTLRRDKGYTLVNIAGLTLGLACCLIIFQYLAFEYGFDDFNDNFAHLYRVSRTTVKGGGEPETSALNGYAMGPALAQSVPEVVRFARIHPDYGDPVISNAARPDKVFEENQVFYADPAFLQMFSYPLVSGDPAKALAEPSTLLISEATARKYFGDETPIGKALNVNGWIDGVFIVNGVFRDVLANSHLQFDFLLPMSDLLKKSAYSDPKHGWYWQNFITYVQLREDANLNAIEQKFTKVLISNRGEDFKRTNTATHLNAQPLRDIHLNDAVFAPKAVQGAIAPSTSLLSSR